MYTMVTFRQKDGHGNSMTKSAQWGRLSENFPSIKETHLIYSGTYLEKVQNH